MSRQRSLLTYLWIGAFLLAISLSGCSSGGSNLDKKETDHINNVAKLAGEYYAANKKTLTSLDELKKWAVKEGKASEEDFLSTRDKQPYGFAAGGMAGLVIYEQTGKGGKAYIYMMGNIHEDAADQVAEQAKRMRGVGMRRGPG